MILPLKWSLLSLYPVRLQQTCSPCRQYAVFHLAGGEPWDIPPPKYLCPPLKFGEYNTIYMVPNVQMPSFILKFKSDWSKCQVSYRSNVWGPVIYPSRWQWFREPLISFPPWQKILYETLPAVTVPSTVTSRTQEKNISVPRAQAIK